MGDFYTIGVSAVLSVTLIGAVRSYALRNAVIDHPTDRSSHTSAMPRGGGLGLIIAVVIAWTLDTSNWIPGTSLALVGVMVVGIVGWLDDHKPVRVGPRLVVHLISALCLIPLALQSNPVPTWMGYSAVVWWLFWGISAVNVVNFMDGIDGLIGSQMLVYGVHLAALGMTGESAHSLGLALAGGCAGFLFWNWTPARMFLGDVGSGALGLIAVLGGVLLLREGNTGLLAAFLPLYPLFLDATVTLLRRISGGERITLPHRTHLYQRLANGGWGHAKVASLYCAGAVIGAIITHAESYPAWTIIILSYALLILVVGYKLERMVPYSTSLHT